MSLAWSPDTQVIALASNDNLVTLWSRNGRKLQTLEHGNTVLSISFSPDGKLIATGGHEKMVKLWNREGQELQTLQRFQEPVNSVSFSPDGQTIAAVSEDKSVSLQTLDPERIEASTKLRTLELDGLLVSACNWVQDYLKYSSDVEQSDRHLCNGIGRSPPKQESG
jgi:WD40 repeat protein